MISGKGKYIKARPRAARSKVSTKKTMIIAGAVLVLVAALVLLLLFLPKDSGEEIIDKAQKADLLTRSISAEEYAFFEKLVERENMDLSEEDRKAETEELICEVNAKFAIGSQLGVCESFTYENMTNNLINENARRESMKEAGEVFYGPESFEEIGYYNYITSNLDLDIARAFTDDDKLFKNIRSQYEKEIKEYFETSLDTYTQLEKVTYELSIDGGTPEVIEADWGTLREMYITEDPLALFLMEGAKGEVYEFETAADKRTAKIISVSNNTPVYEDNIIPITQNYVSLVYYPKLLELAVAKSKLQYPR